MRLYFGDKNTPQPCCGVIHSGLLKRWLTLKKITNTLIEGLEKELKLIESEDSNILQKSELSIYKTHECLKKLEKFALSANFKNIQEEISFLVLLGL